MATSRTDALGLIRENIQRHGFHLYIVQAGMVPRLAYTIGLRESLGFELALAGAVYYTHDEVVRMVNTIVRQLRSHVDAPATFTSDDLGAFVLREIDQTWSRALLIGAHDYYGNVDVSARQIVPDAAHWTIDIPDLSKELSFEREPAWRWSRHKWEYSVPPNSTAMTNLEALRGRRITEATRWEEDEWELFAGHADDVTFESARVVPLGTLLAYDPSLLRITELVIGKGIWRHGEGGDWSPFGKGSNDKPGPSA